LERVGGTKLRGLVLCFEPEAARWSPSSELGTRNYLCVLGGSSMSSAEVRDAFCLELSPWEILSAIGRSLGDSVSVRMFELTKYSRIIYL
jgi:hypothetical protein